MNRREFSQLVAGAVAGQALLRGRGQTVQAAKGAQFSVMLWTLEKQASFERCLDMVAEAGYQGVELVGEFQKWTAMDTKLMKRKMRSLGLKFDAMSGVQAGFAVPAETEAFMAQMEEQIRWARVLECPQIILLSGRKVEGLASEDQRRTAIENLKRAADLVAQNNVEIVIEPIDALENPAIYLTTVSEAFEIVRGVNRRQVRVLYDFYHEQRGFGNLIEKLEKEIEWVGLVHIADVPGRHEPGTGEIDYGSIYRKLAELKYSGTIAMEFYPTGDAVASLVKARTAAQEAMRAAGRG